MIEAEFRLFLERIADGSLSVAQWNQATLKPLADPRLETLRRRIVQCAISDGQCSARPVSSHLKSLADEILDGEFAGEDRLYDSVPLKG